MAGLRGHLGLGLILALAGTILLCALYNGLLSGSNASEPSLCTMTYMYPHYNQISMRSSSLLTKKYELYEYNDDSLPRSTDYSGIPILFIPGNAGSFRQVRSIGSTLARAHSAGKIVAPRIMTKEELMFEHKQLKLNHFDVFAVNFHEEFSAFDGGLLTAQSEFVTDCVNKILSLYKDDTSSKTQPTSVILLGHSMGGVVARSVFGSPSYRPSTVRTILTLNTPHVIAPILLHDSVAEFYQNTHLLWQNRSLPIQSELNQAVVLSVGAGWRDIQVHASLSNLESVSFGHNLISTVATSVPYVWVSMDHDSCMWCNQLMTSLTASLNALIDPNTKQITENSVTRTKILRRYFQSSIPQALHLQNDTNMIHDTEKVDTTLDEPKRKAIEALFSSVDPEKFKTTISVVGSSTLASYKSTWDLSSLRTMTHTQILTTLPLDDVTAVLCKNDFSRCIDLKAFAAPMPYQIRETASREFRTLPAHVINAPFTHEGESFDILALATTKKHPLAYTGQFGHDFFLAAQLSEGEHEKLQLESPFGGNLKPSKLVTQIVLNQPLRYLAYRVTVSKANPQLVSNFKPILLQYSNGMMKEERYALDQITLKYHDVFEFTGDLEALVEGASQHQWQLNGQPMKRSNFHLFVFSDPNVGHTVQISVDWFVTCELILRTDGPLVLGAIFVVVLMMISQQLSLAPNALRTHTTVPSVLLSLSQIVSNHKILLAYILAVVPSITAKFLLGSDSALQSMFPSLSYDLIPFPWPDTYEVGVIFSLAISILAFWGFLTNLFFRVLNASLLSPKAAPVSPLTKISPDQLTEDTKIDSSKNEPIAQSRANHSSFTLQDMPISALVIGTLLTLACCWVHPAIGLIGALFYLVVPPSSNLFASASPPQIVSTYHLRHGFFVLYSTFLLLVGPSGLIWFKNLQWSHEPFDSYWQAVTAIIWHVVIICNVPPSIALQKDRLNGHWMAFAMAALMALFYLFRASHAATFLLCLSISSAFSLGLLIVFGPPKSAHRRVD